MVAPGGKFGSLEFDDEGTRLYAGDFAEFSELKLQNLRPVPGGSADVPQEKNQSVALSCPQCGAVVEIAAKGDYVHPHRGAASLHHGTKRRAFRHRNRGRLVGRQRRLPIRKHS